MRWLLLLFLLSCAEKRPEYITTENELSSCWEVQPDCYDLERSFDAYNGVWFTSTGKAQAYDCEIAEPHAPVTIIQSGFYQAIVYIKTASKVNLAMVLPNKKYLGTFMNVEGVYHFDLGYLHRNTELELGTVVFFYDEAYGPYYQDAFLIYSPGPDIWSMFLDDFPEGYLNIIVWRYGQCWVDYL